MNRWIQKDRHQRPPQISQSVEYNSGDQSATGVLHHHEQQDIVQPAHSVDIRNGTQVWQRLQGSVRGRRALPFVLLLGFLYGSTMVLSRFSVGMYDPRAYVSLRLVLASLAHIAVYQSSGRIGKPRQWSRNPNLWKLAAILGVIGTAIPMTSIVSSLQYQSSGVTALFLTLNPVITLLLAQAFLPDELLTWRKGLGAAIALAGASLLLFRGETGLADFVEADWRGYAWVFLGVLASASAGIFARRYMRDLDSWDVASVRMFAAAATLVPVTYFTVGYDLSGVTTVGYVVLLYAALIGTFSGMWLNFYILKRFGATSASQVSYVIPVFTTVLGALILGETVTGGMLTGMAIIFVGIALLNSRGKSNEKRNATNRGKSPC